VLSTVRGEKTLISEQKFDPEDEGSMFLKNFAQCLTGPTAKNGIPHQQ
jgi:hypothetical protein